MATLIQTTAGASYYTNITLDETKTAIDMLQPIAVWWFAAWGQRYAEDLLVGWDQVAYLRTESDDG